MPKCDKDCICGRHTVTEEWREKQRQAHKGRIYKPESIEKMRQAAIGRKHTLETRQRLSEILKGAPGRHHIPHTTETKQLIGLANKGCVPWNKGKTNVYTEDALRRISAGVKKRWQEGTLTVTCQAPNKSELYLASMIAEYGFVFVGNRQLIIAGKSPDFWDGENRLIELYSEYWHNNLDIRVDDPQDRIDLFKQYGYDCLVIWETDLFNNWQKVKASIDAFTEA